MDTTKPTEPRFISLSHLMAPMNENDIHFFVIPTGQESHLESKDDMSRYIYQTIIMLLQGTPKFKREVIDGLNLPDDVTKQQASKIFDALVQKNIIADASQLAVAFGRTWQNNPVYDPLGYTSEAQAEEDRQPYAVAPGTGTHTFKGRDHYSRRSTRQFDPKATLAISEVEKILADTYRTVPGEPHPIPSPGGIYPVRIHLIQPGNRIVGSNGSVALEAGIYQYDPHHLTLEKRTNDAFPGKSIVEYLVNSPDAADPTMYLAISVDTQAFARKYGNASLMFQGIVTGGVTQRITDVTEAMGLGTLSLFGIKHTEADRILNHPANIKTVLVIAIGKQAEAASAMQRTSTFKPLIEKLRVGAQAYLLGSGSVNFGDTEHTGMPNTFMCMCVKHPQLLTNGETRDGYAFGTASTEDEALLKATAEALERVAMSNARNDITLTAAGKLDAAWIDPRTVMPFDEQQLLIDDSAAFTPQLALNWVRGKRLKTNETVYAPAALVYYPYIASAQEAHIARTTSSGVAAHFDREKAVQSGLLELIERDAIMRTWITRESPVRIDTQSLPGSLAFRIQELESLGKQVDVLQMKSNGPLPTYMVTIRGDKFPYFYAGAAAKLSAEEAIHKALDEAVAGYTSRIMLERFLKKEDADKNAKGIFDADSHGMFYAMHPEARQKLDWLFEGERKPLETQSTATFTDLVSVHDPAVFDLDNPAEGNELRIVRVICEDLIPMQFGKIGVPYLHHTLPPGVSKPELPHFFN
jgi:ribosomal protein S12 methylthiotransferase accessory factor